MRAPLLVDDDQRPFLPAPAEYVSPFAWDGANQLVFRPVSRFFAVDPAGRAVNVNALDEVPNSSWFENRIGVHDMTLQEIARGPCDEKVLDPGMADGTWIIDQGKPNGANPGFRVNVPGLGKFMLKADPDGEPERATGATAIAARIYHAAGYFAPCDSVVYFRPSLLKLKPGLTVTDNSGVTKPFDQKALDAVLARASRRGTLLRMGASKWLPGKTLGPYTYDGLRKDDPNDVILHEDRRELRGARILAAWLNHFDTREQNTMDVFLQSDPKAKVSPGFVRHYILDLGDCFGSVWSWDEISRRLGYAYYFDFNYVAEDFATLGLIERPWERAQRSGGIFNYFSERDFEPEQWRGGYPNPAFTRMTEADGAWMARIIARFSREQIDAAVAVGQYEPADTRYLANAIALRRMAILRRYLTRLSPLTDVVVQGDRLCATDLARANGLVPDGAVVSARAVRQKETSALRVVAPQGGGLCIDLPHYAKVPRGQDAYFVVEIQNGHAPGVLRAHLYDAPQGFVLAGLERPE